jgi:hypothetical protein
MTNSELYQIVFDGTLTGEIAVDKVKSNLGAMFKMNATQVEALFSGKPIVIKRNVDEATAKKYQAAFTKAGAQCTLIAASTAQSPTKAATPSSGSISRETGRMSGKDIVNKKVPTNLGGLTIGQPGETIPTQAVDQEFELPDLSQLSLAQDEDYLTKPKDTPEPNVNISGLKMEDID